MTNYNGLQGAIAVAKNRFELLKERYPSLKMYLVLSSNLGQVDIDSPFETIVDKFAAMLVDDHEKEVVMRIMGQLRGFEAEHRKDESSKNDQKIQRKIRELKSSLASYVDKVSYKDDINIEIRFKSLNYETIRKLKADELINQRLTSHSDASINVVIGSVGEISRC